MCGGDEMMVQLGVENLKKRRISGNKNGRKTKSVVKAKHEK